MKITIWIQCDVITLNCLHDPDLPQFLQKWLPVVLLIYIDISSVLSPRFLSKQYEQLTTIEVWPCSYRILFAVKNCSICFTDGRFIVLGLERTLRWVLELEKKQRRESCLQNTPFRLVVLDCRLHRPAIRCLITCTFLVPTCNTQRKLPLTKYRAHSNRPAIISDQ